MYQLVEDAKTKAVYSAGKYLKLSKWVPDDARKCEKVAETSESKLRLSQPSKVFACYRITTQTCGSMMS